MPDTDTARTPRRLRACVSCGQLTPDYWCSTRCYEEDEGYPEPPDDGPYDD